MIFYDFQSHINAKYINNREERFQEGFQEEVQDW